MDVQNMSFADDSFDTVVSMCVFCSVPHPERGLSETQGSCRPGPAGSSCSSTCEAAAPLPGRSMDLMNPLPFHLYGASINRGGPWENLRCVGYHGHLRAMLVAGYREDDRGGKQQKVSDASAVPLDIIAILASLIVLLSLSLKNPSVIIQASGQTWIYPLRENREGNRAGSPGCGAHRYQGRQGLRGRTPLSEQDLHPAGEDIKTGEMDRMSAEDNLHTDQRKTGNGVDVISY